MCILHFGHLANQSGRHAGLHNDTWLAAAVSDSMGPVGLLTGGVSGRDNTAPNPSCLRTCMEDGREEKPVSWSPQPLPHPAHVGAHLGQQGKPAGEAAMAAQSSGCLDSFTCIYLAFYKQKSDLMHSIHHEERAVILRGSVKQTLFL